MDNTRNHGTWERQIKLLARKYNFDDLKICNKLRSKALKWYSKTDCIKLNSKDLLIKLQKMFDLRSNKLQMRVNSRKENEDLPRFSQIICIMKLLWEISSRFQISRWTTRLFIIRRYFRYKLIIIDPCDSTAELLETFFKVNLKSNVSESKISRRERSGATKNNMRKKEEKKNCKPDERVKSIIIVIIITARLIMMQL